MDPQLELLQTITRRQFLGLSSFSLGAMAMASLAGASEPGATKGTVPFLLGQKSGQSPPSARVNPLAPKRPHFAPKATRVIYIHLTGSPPNLDMFDYKPELVKRDGQPCPDQYTKGKRFAFTTGTPKLLGTRHKFRQHGKSGMWFSDAVPNLAEVADELCFVRSMHTDQFNHAPAELLVFTGSPRPGRPSMGAWVTYGLGTENHDLPGFIVLISSGSQPNGGKNSFGSGFLPTVYQGVQCRSKGDPVLYVSNPPGMDRQLRRMTIDALDDLNQIESRRLGHPETITRISQYELAFRMQVSVPEVMDISREPRQIQEEYGAEPGASSLANNILLARRLVERGVRFVQLFDWGWDFHGTTPAEEIVDGLTKKCRTMDRAIAALIRDLRRRGLLDETLVVIGGEFGRTPFREGRTSASKLLGRDHYPDCYTMLLAGAGVKRGFSYGATDELGFSVTENGVHVHDLQATILQLLGFDHLRLTYRFQGRDFRLTDVEGKVVKDILT